MALVPPLAVAGGISCPTALHAQEETRIDIPAGRLSASLRVLARQTGVNVAGTNRGIGALQVPAVSGSMTPGEALRRLLAATRYRARRVNARTFRIERRPAPRMAAARPAVLRASFVETVDETPIVVTASKRAIAFNDYPGGVTVIAPERLTPGALGDGMDAMLADVPVTSGTALGSGRNKIFIRGIADSSFNGNSQATVGLYLGEQRLTYTAPNPDLRLYDVETVEVLQGPQGTLYGSSTIGGLLRINPRRPDPSSADANAWAAGSATAKGGVGGTLGGMANVPLSQSVAVRTVAYAGHSPGYIDDTLRGVSNINHSDHYGVRAALSAQITQDWNAELSGFGHWTETADGQYIDASLPGLTRQSAIAQPFSGRIAGGNLTVRGQLGDLELTSATGIVGHQLDNTFESTGLFQDFGTQTFTDGRNIRLISHETRIADTGSGPLSWVAGLSALNNRDEYLQEIFLSVPNATPRFSDIVSRVEDYAVFGEGSYEFARGWTLTLGGRLAYTKNRARGVYDTGPLGDTPGIPPDEGAGGSPGGAPGGGPGGGPGGDPGGGPMQPPQAFPVASTSVGATYFLPAAALSWRIAPELMAYVRFHEGYRAGGTTVRRDVDRVPVAVNFKPDRVFSYEGGLRGTVELGLPVDFAVTYYYTKWRDQQADVLTPQGYPDTRTVGEGKIHGITAEAGFGTAGGWEARLALAAADAKQLRSLPNGEIGRVTLPSAPDFTAHARVAKQWRLPGGESVSLGLTGRYIGDSIIDLPVPAEEERQGDFASLDAALTWQRDRWELNLEVLNLTDSDGNRFSFGNPIMAIDQEQHVPLRPLTVRISTRITL